MRLIFIRHGDPDYVNDNLTEKGKREAALLAPRMAALRNVSAVYLSPFGRAQATAEPSLKRMGREGVTLPWLREFSYQIEDPVTGRKHVPWDLMPEYFTGEPLLYDKDRWMDAPVYDSNPDVRKYAPDVYAGIDELLASYGYIRQGDKAYYHVERSSEAYIRDAERSDFNHDCHRTDDDDTLLFFCHLGVALLVIGYLTGISPLPLWQGIYLAPTSVTVLNEERRLNGNAAFRIQTLGDTGHLRQGEEPVSYSGAFGPVFQEDPL